MMIDSPFSNPLMALFCPGRFSRSLISLDGHAALHGCNLWSFTGDMMAVGGCWSNSWSADEYEQVVFVSLPAKTHFSVQDLASTTPRSRMLQLNRGTT